MIVEDFLEEFLFENSSVEVVIFRAEDDCNLVFANKNEAHREFAEIYEIGKNPDYFLLSSKPVTGIRVIVPKDGPFKESVVMEIYIMWDD